IQTGQFLPGADKTVVLPLPKTPRNADFMLTVTLAGRSPEGCIDILKMDVGISAMRGKPLRTIEIIDNYSKVVPLIIDKLDPAIKKAIDPIVFTDLKTLLVVADSQVDNAVALEVINKGGFDKSIGELGANIRSLMPANGFPQDDAYFEIIFTTSIITYCLLALRGSDADKKVPVMAATLATVLVAIESLINARYAAPPLLVREFDSVEPEVFDRVELKKAFNNIEFMLEGKN
ncbi:MAG: hypothetical protein M3R17_13545, partial [Bacteroidota bacterium]|nr:hypothetical protein [Bacteroidota bacterium]